MWKLHPLPPHPPPSEKVTTHFPSNPPLKVEVQLEVRSPPPSKAGERGGCTLCDPVLNLAHILLSQNIHVVQQWFDIHYWVSEMISKVSVGQSFRTFSCEKNDEIKITFIQRLQLPSTWRMRKIKITIFPLVAMKSYIDIISKYKLLSTPFSFKLKKKLETWLPWISSK